jgi:hypothetical protein
MKSGRPLVNTFRTWRDSLTMSAPGGAKQDNPPQGRDFRF